MSVLTQLQEDMKRAMKSGDKQRLSVIRMLLSDVKNIDLAPKKTTEEEAVAAYAKKLRKSIEEYERIGRSDDAAQLRQELQIAESYLPKKANEAETAAMIDAFLESNSFSDKQFGPAMGAFLKGHANVDSAIVSRLLKQKLAGRQA